MAGAAWLRWGFAGLLAVICLSCVIRVAAARRDETPGRREEFAQVVMGLGMIAMFLSWTGLAPRVVYLLVFGVSAAGYAALLLRDSVCAPREAWECTHHVMASVAMIYMAVGTAAVPALAGAFGVYFLGYAGWGVLRVAGGGAVVTGSGVVALLRRPRVIEACRATMGLSMAYLLLSAM